MMVKRDKTIVECTSPTCYAAEVDPEYMGLDRPAETLSAKKRRRTEDSHTVEQACCRKHR